MNQCSAMFTSSHQVDAHCAHISFTTHLIAFEVRTSAGCETLFTAEALELGAHAERVALYPFLLAPDAHNLHILYVVHCGGKNRRGFRVIIDCNLRR